MGKNSSIEWCHHTHNIVWGCQRVSPGCQHCYAETLAKRYGHDVWGPAKTTARREMSAAYWQQPYKWNKAAQQAGERARVFCGSMSDVFEDHPTNADARERLWPLIDATPWLDWLLLTKRPENISRMLPAAWLETPQANVWLGTSVEDQQRADERIPHLLRVPAAVRFLSCEPLLGPVNIRDFVTDGAGHWRTPTKERRWVIAGGESGHGARPMNPNWARSLRQQCEAAGVSFFFKQWGEELPKGQGDHGLDERGLYRRESFISGHAYYRVGKHAAGRLLDGVEWNELPI